MRLQLLSILRCPLDKSELTVENAHAWRSDDNLEMGILKSVGGQSYPVVCGIPILKTDLPTREIADRLLDGEDEFLTYDLLNGQPQSWLTHKERTFKQALYQLVGRWSADYFYFRRSDPTFMVTLSLLRTVERRVGIAFDLGCGCGHFTQIMLKLPSAKRVVGVDSTFKLLYVAKRFIAPQGEYVCCDLETGLPFSSHQAKTVLCSDTFSFLRNKWACAREMERLLQPTGTLLVTRILLEEPIHWDARKYQLLPLQDQLDLFESTPMRVVSDRAVRQAYLEGGELNLNVPPADDEETCSLVSVPSAVGLNPFPPFLEPHAAGQVCPNPLYRLVKQDEEKSVWQRTWPSQWYEKDYAAASHYLPREFRLPRDWSEQIIAGSAEWLRRRWVLPLPAHYGDVFPGREELLKE